MTFLGAIKKTEGPIPDLRPPKDHIAIDVPESVILKGALIFAFAVLVVGRLARARHPAPPMPVEPPVVLARRALASVTGPTIIADCEQIVRRYLFNSFGLGPEGATSNELCVAFAAHPLANATTLAALEAYLDDSDRARFAENEARDLAATCVERARTLIEQLEQRHSVAEPPPLPIAT